MSTTKKRKTNKKAAKAASGPKKDGAMLRRLKKEAEPWNPSMTWREFREKGSMVFFEAKSAQNYFDDFERFLTAGHPKLKRLPKIDRLKTEWRNKAMPIGDMLIGRQTWPHRTALSNSRRPFLFIPQTELSDYSANFLDVINNGKVVGEVGFSDDTTTTAVWDQYGTVWMSITFSEIMSQRSGVRAGRGKVFIGGMGLGWLAREVGRRDQVDEVVVVEKHVELAKFMRPNLKAEFPEKPVKVITGDAYEHLEKHGEDYDSVLMDIWPNAGDAPWDRRWMNLKAELEEKGVRCWHWS